MTKAKDLDKPVKLSNYTEKLDEFTTKPLLMLASRSSILYSEKNIPYNKVKGVVEKINSFSPLSEIANMSVEEMVNVAAYVEIANTQVIELTTRYGPRKKRDVMLYDDTIQGYVKLCIWSKFVESIPESGTYKFLDLRLKSFGEKYLTTTNSTVIEKSDISIAKQDVETKNDVNLKVPFPASSINLFEKVHFCNKCFRKALPKGLFVLCDFCGSKSLLNPEDQRFDVKASFMNGDENVSLTIPHLVFVKFADLVNVPTDQVEELQLKLLTCKDLEVTHITLQLTYLLALTIFCFVCDFLLLFC